MYILQNESNEIIAWSTSQVNENYVWTDEEVVDVGGKMFFASQTEEIEKAKAEYEIESKKQEEIERLKAELSATDYKCLKWMEGALTDDEYAETKAYRAELRQRINELQRTE